MRIARRFGRQFQTPTRTASAVLRSKLTFRIATGGKQTIGRTGGVRTSVVDRSTGTVYEEIPSVYINQLSPTVDDGILLVLWELSGRYRLTPMQHVLTSNDGCNSLSGYHIADPSATRMTILSRSIGVDGSHEDEVVMGCAGWVGSKSDNTVRVMATNRKTFPETVSRHRREQPVQFSAARRSALRHRQRLAGLEECVPLFWRSTSTA